MGFERSSVYSTDILFSSNTLRRVISGLTDTAVVFLDADNANMALSSLPAGEEGRADNQECALPSSDPGRLQKIDRISLKDRDIATLDASVGARSNPKTPRHWEAFSCTFQDGSKDRIALQLDPDQDMAFTKTFIEKIWPVLREDCIGEARGSQPTSGEDAMLWMISDRIDVAILVLDARGRMLRINLAAKALLDNGEILKRGKGGIFARNEQESRKFRTAVAECALAEDPDGSETILFLDGGPHGIQVPVSLSPYYHKGKPSELVVAMLPMPPDPARVEMMGRKMGLSSSEARVAALMQSGMTNREAACQAGLKEQTFNTYAKRVMNKLHVNGRTEMAQLLTWQAAGRRIA